MNKVRGLILAAGLLLSGQAWATTYYVSPNGSDAADGLSIANARKTFGSVFGLMSAGDELVLVTTTPAGTYTHYSTATGTGYINHQRTADGMSGGPPDGTAGNYVTVRATTPWVRVTGGVAAYNQGLLLGTATDKSEYVRIATITFYGGGSLFNTNRVEVLHCGFNKETETNTESVFSVGTNDQCPGGSGVNCTNTGALIEDSWAWGKQRIVFNVYRSSAAVVRRVAIRGDGCSTCTGSGNPNVRFTVYESSQVAVQNVVILDSILNGGFEYQDFSTAQNTAGWPLGEVYYEGNISLNSEAGGMIFEASGGNVHDFPNVKNCVVWDSSGTQFNLAIAEDFYLENVTAGVIADATDNIRVVNNSGTGSVKNIIAVDAGRYGVNSSVQPSYSDVYSPATGNYNQTSCATGCKTTDPQNDGTPPSLKYITRIETGSALKGTGDGGADYGANVVNQIGTTGTHWGETGYLTESGTSLWPWLHQDTIKRQFCTDSGVTRDWCGTSDDLTNYVWGYLGNDDHPYAPVAAPSGGNPRTRVTISVGSY